MTRYTVMQPRTAPESSGCAARMDRVTLPLPPFPVEIDAARRDTAPRGNPAMLPPRKLRVVQIEPGIMDMNQ